MRASEFPEDASQEFESIVTDPLSFPLSTQSFAARRAWLRSLSLIRSVLAAYAASAASASSTTNAVRSAREWFQVMAAVKAPL